MISLGNQQRLRKLTILSVPYGHLAMAYLKTQKLKKAEQMAIKAMAIDSGNARAYFVLAVILEKEKSYEAALKQFDRYFQIKHDDEVLVQKAKIHVEKIHRLSTYYTHNLQTISKGYDKFSFIDIHSGRKT
jgi:tetratricopeptide (TPR) repeat protein